MNTDPTLETLLYLVDSAAKELAPDEHTEAFGDYANLARATGQLPAADEELVDPSDSGFVDGHLFLGVGLAIIGQAAVVVFNTAQQMAAEKGLRNLLELVRPGSGENRAELEERVNISFGIPEGVSSEEAHRLLALQIQALDDYLNGSSS